MFIVKSGNKCCCLSLQCNSFICFLIHFTKFPSIFLRQ
nr:MAG TPA: hypothetical protein [Caudoviricetes sp.]